MVFASITFLFYFLPICLLLYFISENQNYRNIVLIISSLFFYAWGEPIWVSLLVLSATVDYGCSWWIEKHRGDTTKMRLGLLTSLAVNLGLLASFKYNVFIYENINWLLGTTFKVPKYDLPIGISFYTFQTISYTIDVYWGNVAAQRSFLKFLMYVSLFPQLVAGPIVRYSTINEEVENRTSNPYDISQGMLRFCIGLFKKVYIADVAGGLATSYLDGNLADLSTGEAWFGIMMFSLQIYFDFSGYSDMAIGMGRMFGFHFLENFNYPYIAKSATDFWRRWHISLGSFFRDYVYIPLGGNQKRAILNLFIVWFLTGLWHGASWNYVLWGLYFGLLIYIERIFLLDILKKIPAFFSHIYLLFIAILGWALFYFEDGAELRYFLSILFGNAENFWSYELTSVIQENIFWLIFALVWCLPIYPKFATWLENDLRTQKPVIYGVVVLGLQILLLVISVAMLAGDTYKAFIYYRF